MKFKLSILCVLSVAATGTMNAQNNTLVSVGNTSSTYEDAIFAATELGTDEYYLVNFNSDNNIYMCKNSGGTDGVHLMEIDRAKGKVTLGFTSESARGPQISVSATSQGYATICSPFLLKMPAETDIKVYAPTYDNNMLRLNPTTQVKPETIVPIATPLVIKANTTPTSTASYPFAGHSTYSGTFTSPTNALKGTVHAIAKSSVTSGTVYTLGLPSDNSGKIGFYKYTGDNIPYCRAYLILDASNNALAKAIMFDEGTTGIDGISNLESEKSNVAYNLGGQRVNLDTKGIIIVNGKKILNK